MKNKSIVVITTLLVALVQSEVFMQAAEAVDQEQPVIDVTVGGSAIGGNSQQKLAQVVTAGVSGLLSEVRLPIACDVATLRIEIQDVTNGVPNDSIMAAETFDGTGLPPFFPTPGVVTLRSFTFSAPAIVEAGRQFAIVLSATASAPLSGCGIFQGPVGDSYPGGNFFFDSRPNASNVWVCVCEFAGGRFDLPFQTVVQTFVEPPVAEVSIDVKPGSSINRVRLRPGEIIPVAILGTPMFRVATVDISSIRFGPDKAPVVRGRRHLKDVNRDGVLDLVVYFKVRESGIQAGDTEVSLTGMTLDGEHFQGSDRILIVGPKGHFQKHRQ